MSASDWFGEDFQITPGNPSGFMVYAQQLGLSARESLDAWRELGGTSGNQNWHTMYGQIADALSRIPDQAALDPTVLPGPTDYATWAAGRGGQFATQVGVVVTDVETGLQSTLQYTYFSDVPHTPDEARQAAMDEYGSSDNESRYGQVVNFAYPVHLFQTVAYDMGG